jgi:hypothetical protein
MEAGVHGIEQRLATTNTYLQILVERGWTDDPRSHHPGHPPRYRHAQ